MHSFSEKFINAAQKILPSPFSIAIIITGFTFILALLLGDIEFTSVHGWLKIAEFWQKGFWELLSFTMQMMLILVLGHTLALSKPINDVIALLLKHCNTASKSIYVVCVSSLVVALFNWGLGLVFGAILARKVAEHALANDIKINYPLVGAAAYSGLMVWHGGLSGSAPLTVSAEGHFLEAAIGVIPLAETLFSWLNISTTLLLLIIIPFALVWIGKKNKTVSNYYFTPISEQHEKEYIPLGAERLDFSKTMVFIPGILILILTGYNFFQSAKTGKALDFLSLNSINFLLFGLCLLFHGNAYRFQKAVGQAIEGSSGILIQFPLYAGIMGIMKYSGLISVFSTVFIAISTTTTFPLFTLFSAAAVNVFVPSGGGQWALQGPIIVETAQNLGLSTPKCIMALAYGDQLTNMMQPFWALPLLGITQLKAKDILPYSLFTMLIGMLIFAFTLLIF